MIDYDHGDHVAATDHALITSLSCCYSVSAVGVQCTYYLAHPTWTIWPDWVHLCLVGFWRWTYIGSLYTCRSFSLTCPVSWSVTGLLESDHLCMSLGVVVTGYVCIGCCVSNSEFCAGIVCEERANPMDIFLDALQSAPYKLLESKHTSAVPYADSYQRSTVAKNVQANLQGIAESIQLSRSISSQQNQANVSYSSGFFRQVNMQCSWFVVME